MSIHWCHLCETEHMGRCPWEINSELQKENKILFTTWNEAEQKYIKAALELSETKKENEKLKEVLRTTQFVRETCQCAPKEAYCQECGAREDEEPCLSECVIAEALK